MHRRPDLTRRRHVDLARTAGALCRGLFRRSARTTVPRGLSPRLCW
ncbi:putative leader peptide [Streptomyces sp. YIM 130001]